MMKRFAILVIVVAQLIGSTLCYANEEAISSIKAIAGGLEKGLVNKRILCGRPGRYYLLKIDKVLDVGYDVQTTTSLISPYTALIEVMTEVHSNIKSPNANGQHSSAFTTSEAAIAAQAPEDFEDAPAGLQDRPEFHRQQATARYAYQDKHWVLKSISGGDFIYLSAPGNEEVMALFAPLN